MKDNMLQLVVHRDSAGFVIFIVHPHYERNDWPPNVVFMFGEPINDGQTFAEALSNAEEAVKAEAKRRGIPRIDGLTY